MIPNIGDKAPSFSVKNQNGEEVTLEQFAGKKLVLFFYPKDNTPGCTKEACDLRDNYERFKAEGYEVAGVSIDGEASHQKFITKFELPYQLLADTEHELVNAYGVWQEKKNYGRTYMGTVRTTFIIDENGVISDVIKKVKTAEHTSQILKSE